MTSSGFKFLIMRTWPFDAGFAITLGTFRRLARCHLIEINIRRTKGFLLWPKGWQPFSAPEFKEFSHPKNSEDMNVEIPLTSGCAKWSHVSESFDSDPSPDSPCIDPPLELAPQQAPWTVLTGSKEKKGHFEPPDSRFVSPLGAFVFSVPRVCGKPAKNHGRILRDAFRLNQDHEPQKLSMPQELGILFEYKYNTKSHHHLEALIDFKNTISSFEAAKKLTRVRFLPSVHPSERMDVPSNEGCAVGVFLATKKLYAPLPELDEDAPLQLRMREPRVEPTIVAASSSKSSAIAAPEAEKIVLLSKPLVRVLRLVDEDKSPMGYLHEAMDRAKESIMNKLDNNKANYMPLWEMVDNIWDRQMYSPLHVAGYFLNPTLFFSDSFQDDVEGLEAAMGGLLIYKQGFSSPISQPSQEGRTSNQVDNFFTYGTIKEDHSIDLDEIDLEFGWLKNDDNPILDEEDLDILEDCGHQRRQREEQPPGSAASGAATSVSSERSIHDLSERSSDSERSSHQRQQREEKEPPTSTTRGAATSVEGAVFDLPEDVAKELLLKQTQPDCTISKITKLPSLEDDEPPSDRYGRFSGRSTSNRGYRGGRERIERGRNDSRLSNSWGRKSYEADDWSGAQRSPRRSADESWSGTGRFPSRGFPIGDGN
ncbi:hypothetical protein KI387_002649, partial [Taxus chinensis]